MAAQLPDVQHLRVQRVTDAKTDTDTYTFTTDFGGTAEMIATRRLDRHQRDAAVNEIGNIATDLKAFADHKGSQSAGVSLDAHGRTLADQVVPESVRDLLHRPNEPLLISTTDPGFPWQLVLVGETPLGLLRPIAIRATLPQRHETAPLARASGVPRSALLIADPTGDHAQARAEIEAISSVLRALDPQMRIVSLLHAEATLEKVQHHLSQPYDLIHYAGHLRWEERDGGERGIVLWGQQLLRISAIHHTRHPGAAVFLNGCWGSAFKFTLSPDSFQMSVPTHPQRRPEGFGVEFARAGARSYLAPLWPVYDALAADFSQRVYAYLVAGHSFGDALLQVRRDLRRARPWDPTWAVYVLYGHPCEPLFDSMLAHSTVPDATAARATPSAASPAEISPTGAPRTPPDPPSPGELRGADLHPMYLQEAHQVEQHWFANDPGHLADDAHTAVALALRTLHDQRRNALHTLDLLVAALNVFATVPSASDLLADLANGPTVRDLLAGSRYAPIAASGEHTSSAARAYAAFRAVDVLIYSDERLEDASGKLSLARLAGEAVRRAAELADEASRDAVTCADLIEALLAEPRGNFGSALNLLRCDPAPTVARLREHRLASAAAWPVGRVGASGGNIPTPIGFGYPAAFPLPEGATQADTAQAAMAAKAAPAAIAAASPVPARTLGRDLLDRARGGGLRYVAGWTDRSRAGGGLPTPDTALDPDPRRALFDRLAATLTRGSSPHALIVGADGAGRWALVEALAYALAATSPDPAVAALAGLPLLALHPKSSQPPGASAAGRLAAFLGQLGSGTPAILVVRDLPGFFAEPAAHVEIVAALDRAFATQGLRLVVTAREASYLAAVLGSHRVGRFEQIVVPPASQADALRMIAGHMGWLFIQKQIPIPPEAQAAAADETGPLAHPGLGLRILALACDARLAPVTSSHGGDTVISMSSIGTLPADATAAGLFAPLTVAEVRAAARSLRDAR